MDDFKDVLVYLRKRAGLSQIDLAEKLNISKSAISMYENGSRRPSYEMLEAIADYFNVDIDFLTAREQNGPALSSSALGVASQYDMLDDHGRAVIEALIQLEVRRMEDLNGKE